MHRLQQALLSFLGCLLLGLGGCSVDSLKPVHIRSIYVEEALGAPSPDLAQCADVIHDTSVRVLLDRGYIAATEPVGADAFLHAVWIARPLTAGMPAGRVTLRMTLVASDGMVMGAVDAVADAPAGLLTKERIAELLRRKLETIGR